MFLPPIFDLFFITIVFLGLKCSTRQNLLTKKKSLLSEQFANLCTGLKTDYTIKNYTLIAFISRLHMAWQQ